MKNPFRSSRWIPLAHREILTKLKSHLESGDILGFDVGEGEEVVSFLARLGDMDAVQALLIDSPLSAGERKAVLEWVEERRDELPRPTRRSWFW
jgi:hypothetical protein